MGFGFWFFHVKKKKEKRGQGVERSRRGEAVVSRSREAWACDVDDSILSLLFCFNHLLVCFHLRSTHHDVTSSSFSVITGPSAIVMEEKKEREAEGEEERCEKDEDSSETMIRKESDAAARRRQKLLTLTSTLLLCSCRLFSLSLSLSLARALARSHFRARPLSLSLSLSLNKCTREFFVIKGVKKKMPSSTLISLSLARGRALKNSSAHSKFSSLSRALSFSLSNISRFSLKMVWYLRFLLEG